MGQSKSSNRSLQLHWGRCRRNSKRDQVDCGGDARVVYVLVLGVYVHIGVVSSIHLASLMGVRFA